MNSEDSKPSNATPSSKEVSPERHDIEDRVGHTPSRREEESAFPDDTFSAWGVEEQLQETFLAQPAQACQSPVYKRGFEPEEPIPEPFTAEKDKERPYDSQFEHGQPLPEPYTAQDERPQARIASPPAPAAVTVPKAIPEAIARPSIPPAPGVSPRVQVQAQARPIPKTNFSAFEQSPIRSPNTATREWSRTIQPYSASPSNLINLSESPQTVPSSFDDKSVLGGWNQRDNYRTTERAPTQYSQSTSPPTHTNIAASFINRRPLSGQHLEKKSMLEDTMSKQPQNPYGRRNSGYSQLTDRHRTPPQHGFQQHFHMFGAPDVNLGGGKRPNGLKPGERGYYCGFDTMNVVRGGKARNTPVVITGYEGGLDIRHASKRGATQVAQLGGLRGGVSNAKILPWTIDSGPYATRGSTLVAVVVHGPVLEDAADVDFGEEAGDEMRNRRSGSTTGTEARRKNAIREYQTTVEVYDVKTQRYIATLLTVPPIELKMAYMGPRFTPPPPSGALSIHADAGNIVITSGQTGELWVFKQAMAEKDFSPRFKCLGKYWTTVQQQTTPEPVDHSQRLDSARSVGNDDPVKKTRSKTGLVSLRGRWLTFCHSSNIHAIRLGAIVDTSLSNRPATASINTYAPPQLPSTTCAVDTPPGDDWKARLGRQAAQGAITGANYVYGQTSKAIKNYWNAPIQTAQGWQPATAEPQVFPPTHGSTSGKQTAVSDTAHISIIDLHKLANLTPGKKMSASTVATFKLTSGCSYLSLSPSGLHLFTANSNGDRQFIWDLYRCQYPKPSPLTLPRSGYPTTPHIRQICGFSRLTSARIVDVVWTLPGGRTVAMVTERNTVHFLDTPRHLFHWPPPRRPRMEAQSSDVNGSRSVSAAPAAAVKIAGSAISSVRGLAGEWMGRRQSNASDQPASTLAKQETTSSYSGPAPSRGSTIASTLGTYAGVGGKYVAAGLSKSLQATGAAMQQFRRAGDNKLHLPNSDSICASNCIIWLGESKRRRQAFAVALDGFIKIYTIRYIPSKKGAPGRKREPARIVVKGLVKDVIIPSIPDTMMAEVVKRALELDDDLEIGSPSVRAMNDNSRTAVLPVRPFTAGGRIPFRRGGRSGGNAIPMAEIETSSPWRPWCNDYRVSLFSYPAEADSHDDTALVDDQDQDLEGMFSDQVNLRHTATKKPARHGAVSKSAQQQTKDKTEESWAFGFAIEAERLDTGYDEEVRQDGEEEYEGFGLVRTVSRDGEEPIVSTTRRKKAGDLAMLGEGAEEDGFFEDDLEVVDFAR